VHDNKKRGWKHSFICSIHFECELFPQLVAIVHRSTRLICIMMEEPSLVEMALAVQRVTPLFFLTLKKRVPNLRILMEKEIKEEKINNVFDSLSPYHPDWK
jgi:hypothetical protein